MGAITQKMLEDAARKYYRNQYYHERQKLMRLIQLYADSPGFVAKLKQELKVLENNRSK